jgi:hypothetical protein
MMIELALGFILGLILDVLWWKIDYSKYEKGLEVHEHYHIGLELGIIGVLLNQEIFIGLMMSFILAEWSQKNQFALGSNHFKGSTLIGIILSVSLCLIVIFV